MDRTASNHLLSVTAASLTRRVFASLPTGIRLAAVYQKLASAYARAFGLTVYAAALYYGADGLPEIKGSPASNFGPKEGETFDSFVARFTRNPPQKDFGATFGAKIFNKLKSKAGEERATDLLQDLLTKVMDRSSSMHGYFKNLDLSKIEQVLYRAADNLLSDSHRRDKFKKDLPRDEEGQELDIPDKPSDVEKLDDVLTKDQLQRLEQKLKNKGGLQGEDLSTYFDLLMDGFDPHDIFRWRLLPSMQKNLPEELRLDPTSPHPFSSKKEEMSFREELAKYPSPFKDDANALKTYSRPLMQIIREFVEQEAN